MPSLPGYGDAARIEDLEESLRRIVVLLNPDGHHEVTERDAAVLAIACDALLLDAPIVLPKQSGVDKLCTVVKPRSRDRINA